jgi:outer membrane biosynthesis protein TonB
VSATIHDRDGMTPALAGSAVLHVAVAALFLISWPWARELKVGAVVPVKIVTNAPATDVRPAIQAPEEQTAAVETPVPNESLQAPAPPEPLPQPAPTPAPAPVPKPAKPTPPVPTPKPAPMAEKAAPAKPQPAAKPAPSREVDLDKLLASVSKGGRPASPSRSSAARGPTRAETAPQARPAVGAGLSANALSGLTDELRRRWNPNCEVEGGRDVKLRVVFTLGESGNVVGEVSADGEENSSNPVVRAAADRAIRAVYAAAPFRTLPREFYGERIAVRFNAQEACS